MVHIFSHIHQTYVVEGVIAKTDDIISMDSSAQANSRWLTKQEFLEAAVSTAMKKVKYGGWYEHRCSGFPTRSDTNQPVHPQNMARGWKFQI